MKKFICVALSAVLLVVLASCSGGKTEVEDFSVWFDRELVPTYDSYVEAGEGQATFISIQSMLTSDKCIKACFAYMADGTMPENAQISEENGVYIYREGDYYQTFEFNKETAAIQVKMVNEFMGESQTEFEAVFRQSGDEFYIQYLMPIFGEYHELCFTADGGREAYELEKYELEYSILTEDIPEDFAKER